MADSRYVQSIRRGSRSTIGMQ
ncbi:phage tail protein, partial [Escherichia coli]|nr:phage tail protein [Escherichia coli]NYY00681.1 phage tail protein [Escherichia coli]